MRTLFCGRCHSIYNSNELSQIHVCPNKLCSHQLSEMDELIVTSIAILNRKGYKTNASCSGHVYNGELTVYISFEDCLGENENFIPPENFQYFENKSSESKSILKNRIAKYPLTEQERMWLLTELNIELLNWSQNLPTNNVTHHSTRAHLHCVDD